MPAQLAGETSHQPTLRIRTADEEDVGGVVVNETAHDARVGQRLEHEQRDFGSGHDSRSSVSPNEAERNAGIGELRNNRRSTPVRDTAAPPVP